MRFYFGSIVDKKQHDINMSYKHKIKAKGYKMAWLAMQCGVTPASFSNYINGKREMPSFVENKLKMLLK